MKHYILKSLLALAAWISVADAQAIDHPKATLPMVSPDRFTLVADGKPTPIVVSQAEDKAVLIAAENLVEDFERVTGNSVPGGFENKSVRYFSTSKPLACAVEIIE